MGLGGPCHNGSGRHTEGLVGKHTILWFRQGSRLHQGVSASHPQFWAQSSVVQSGLRDEQKTANIRAQGGLWGGWGWSLCVRGKVSGREGSDVKGTTACRKVRDPTTTKVSCPRAGLSG